ncbi:putative transcriptional Regulator, IclR family [Cupriavidus taiwanensis]|uniref:Putative transcriptional Regulator, IclR family n=1 Tax=Cupriavidus taiwanensis TaxID=164546 RepID=A0A375IGT2_9BURK|nr:IclR family transcriptional regulator [Cupriavidus taiwanensis]SPK72749.1 putative transcriptional Regulator, IclR family [Cupriavidus taiwanensis]
MTYIVEAVDEALGLLMLVAEHPSLGVTELARRAGLTKARAFRLLTTLEHRGLIARESPAAVYKLSYNALLVGNAAREQFDLVKLVGPRLAAIGAACGENVIVRVRDGLESVCVARHESTQSVRVHTEIGNRRPLHVGASGKLLLAFAAPEVVEAVLARQLERFTAKTIIEPQALREELAAIRAAGYAVSVGERDADAVSAAAPLRDHSGAAVASLSIASPASRTTRQALDRHVAMVVAEAANLSRALGYAGG